MPHTESQLSAPTLGADGANGVRYAYRRFGPPSPDVPPLVLLQHFRGNLDNWDPALIDALAAVREVVLFDNAGVGGSSGTTPSTVEQMAQDALAFVDALELRRIDLLGYSIGGFLAQDIALGRPDLVRRLVLAGTGPQGAPGMHGWREDIADHARRDEPGAEDLLHIFFAHTPTGQTKGGEFLGRIFRRTEGRDAPTSLATRDAQYEAVVRWGVPDLSKLQRLTGIRQPTLVLQGDDDLMIPTRGSHTMAGLIPDARLTIFPDAAHGALFQCSQEAATAIDEFLTS